MSQSLVNERVLSAIKDLKKANNPLLGTKYHIKGKLKKRIKKNMNFMSIANKKKKRMINSSFGGIRTLSLKCGIPPESKEYKELLEKGKITVHPGS